MPPIRFVDIVGTDVHGGWCCDCGHEFAHAMPARNTPRSFGVFRLQMRGRSWVGSRYVQVREDVVADAPDALQELSTAIDPAKFASRATGPASGCFGTAGLDLLVRHPELEFGRFRHRRPVRGHPGRRVRRVPGKGHRRRRPACLGLAAGAAGCSVRRARQGRRVRPVGRRVAYTAIRIMRHTEGDLRDKECGQDHTDDLAAYRATSMPHEPDADCDAGPDCECDWADGDELVMHGIVREYGGTYGWTIAADHGAGRWLVEDDWSDEDMRLDYVGPADLYSLPDSAGVEEGEF